MNLLVPNLGSTSFKYQLIEMPGERVLAHGRAERVSDYAAAIAGIDTHGAAIDAVAFKAVHGGARYRGTYRIDDAIMDALRRLLPAAPAHNRIYLLGIEAFRAAMPHTSMVAAFETEFHRTMPRHASLYGVPRRWLEDGEVRRYGFHGASHQYVSERAPEIAGRPLPRLVSCHLGGSSSMCAIHDGRSVDTTMGFSPQSGLENATRHGDLDAFAVLYMAERFHLSASQIRDELAAGGGLAGISGIEGGDIRDLEASSTEQARTALDVFAYQVKKTIGAYAAALGGLDGIAFTGGIGENAAGLRRRILDGLEFLGAGLGEANESGSGDRVVSAADSPMTVVVLRTNEELVVARRAYRLLTEG
ncbi:MAG: acetate/propionate family kinase [Bryobacteraceae bacterium]